MNLLRLVSTYFIIAFLSIGSPSAYLFADIAPNTLPTGGNIVSGNITISTPEVGKMDVNQTSNQGIINWDTFNVGSSAAVHFNQPGIKSSVLNNVLSGTSIINGSIFSNGRLIFVNPTGILTGPTSAIRSEGAILSTLKITNNNFLNNNYSFTTNSSSNITTQGKINGEYVALLSPTITNKGTITTNVATALAAGDDIRLSISDSNLLTVAVNPSKIKTSIKNEGNIKTQNGIVTLKTDVAQSVVDDVIKTENAKANGLVTENGVVKLVTNSGTIKAKEIEIDAGAKGASEISGTLNSNSETEKGGNIEVTAKEIDINAATISADGKTGGGEILLGGDWQGSGSLLQATFLSIDNGSKISADALQSGSGGKIVAWTNIKDLNSNTIVNGILTAKGMNGAGGQIETSGSKLNVDSIVVNTLTSDGSAGNWLLDPYNVTIGSSGDGTYIANSDDDNISASSLNSSLSSTNIEITTGSSGTQAGNITISSVLTIPSSRQLTLSAAGGILGSSNIANSGTIIFNNSGDGTYSGVISGAGALTKQGPGTLTLSNTNTYTGGTDITAGTILITNDRNLGATPGSLDADNVIIRNGATLATGNTNVTMHANRGFYVPSGTAKLLKYTRKSWTLNNPISGSGGVNFDDSTANGGNGGGGGRYYLKVANTYSGDTRISFRGTRDPGVVVDHNNAFQNTTVDHNKTDIPNANDATEPLLWFRTTAPVLGGLKGNRDLINEQSFTANAVLNIGNNNEDTTFSGRIRDGARTYGIKKIGTGTLNLTGSNNYSGGTTLAGGSISGYYGTLTLASSISGTFTPSSSVTLTADTSAGGLSGSANINLSSYTLTIGSDNGSTTYSGVLSGAGAITKQGSGTLTLTGVNTYSGNTTISAGTLTLGGSGNLGNGSYAGAIVNNGTFKFDTSANLISTGVISGSGSVLVTGTGTYEPKATNTYTGGTVIDGGIIAAFTDRNWGAYPGSVDSDNIILKNGGKAIFGSKNSSNTAGHTYWAANRGINLPTSGQQFIEMGSGGSGSAHIQGVVNGIGGITFTRSGSKSIRFYGENTYTGDTKFNFTSGSNNNIEITPKAFQNSTVYLSPTRTNVGRGFSRTSGSGNIILGGLAGDMTDWRLVGGRNIEFGSNNANTSVAGGISRYAAAGKLIKKGTGTTTFTATSGQELNSSSIGLQIDAGKLVLNGDWGRNNTAAGTVAIAAGATLAIDTAQNNTYSGVLSGAGTLLLGGTGTSTFSGNNTFSGALNIADGGFKAGHANSFGSATVTSSGGRISTASSITLPSLTVTGNVQLDSGITTTGAQIYNNNVVVKAGTRASAAVISAANSDISFKGTLKGEGNAKARSLTINAGTGDVLFGDRVGYAFNGQTVNINNTADSFYKMTVTGNEITVKGDVMTYEEQTYNGNVLVGSTASNGTTRTFLSMDPKVVFNGTVNDTENGKHTLIAKAVEIDRGSNSTPTVDFKSTVGRTTALKAYSGLTGYQTAGANWGVINTSVSFGTTIGTGQTMGPAAASSSSSSDNGKKAARGVTQFAKTFSSQNNTLSFSSFRLSGGGNSFTFKKNVDIIYGDSPQFGAPAKTFKPRTATRNTKQGGGLFGGFFGKANPNLDPASSSPNIKNDQFRPRGNNEFNNVREPKDIKELFKTFEGGNGKGKFFNPYAIEKRGIEQKNNSNQQNPSNVNNNEEDDA